MSNKVGRGRCLDPENLAKEVNITSFCTCITLTFVLLQTFLEMNLGPMVSEIYDIWSKEFQYKRKPLARLLLIPSRIMSSVQLYIAGERGPKPKLDFPNSSGLPPLRVKMYKLEKCNSSRMWK